MRIILSPAKKMRIDTDSFDICSLPQFLLQTQQILQTLQLLTNQELKTLWNCNDNIAAQNIQHLRTANLQVNLTPALLAYEGIQYQYMAPGVLEELQYLYLQEHLRIVSGFYGLLRPFDGVIPYRLEMQAKLQIQQYSNLYQFWGSQLARQLAAETNIIINLASKEYSRAILPHLPASVQVYTCVFGEYTDGKIKEKATLCKMARGQMVRWMAENNITAPEQLCHFSQLEYCYSASHSSKYQLVFLKSPKRKKEF